MDIWAVNTTFSAKHFPTDFFLPCIKTGAALAFYREERAQGNVNEKEGEQSCSSTHIEAGKSAHGQCGAQVGAPIQENHQVIISPSPGSPMLQESSLLWTPERADPPVPRGSLLVQTPSPSLHCSFCWLPGARRAATAQPGCSSAPCLVLVFLEHSADTPELMLHILTAAATVGQPRANPSLGILVLQ